MSEIRPVLAHYPSDCRPTAVEPLGMAGGLSGAKFWRCVAPRGTLALRRWPAEHPTPDGLRFIHGVLRHAETRGMSILPVPLATTAGATLVRHAGHLWELTPWLPGAADYERSPRVEKLRAAMQVLAEFHIATADFPAQPPRASSVCTASSILTRLARLRALESSGATSLTRAITDTIWPELAPLARQFLAALPRALPIAIARLAPLAHVTLPLQPCIRDVWHDHVLFDGERVTGLIDFGGMQVDTPATDVARLLGSLVGNDAGGWRDGLAAYAAVRPLSESESSAVAALDASGTILALCNWIRWIYVDGRQFENQRQVVTRISKLQHRLHAMDSPIG